MTQLATRRRRTTAGRLPGATPWLFPGATPGQPINSTALGHLLRRHGIRASEHRTAAIAHLAANMPATIVADLLGIGISTATHWAQLTARDWADYTAHRGHQPS